MTIHDEGGAQTTVVSAVASARTELDVDDAFVEQAYRDVLGRAADAGGLANFVNAMQNGMTPATVAASLVNSDEYRINLIEHAYRTFLGRDADQGGLQAWLGAVRNGLTDQELDADFVGSAEFFADSGSNHQTFVTEPTQTNRSSHVRRRFVRELGDPIGCASPRWS